MSAVQCSSTTDNSIVMWVSEGVYFMDPIKPDGLPTVSLTNLSICQNNGPSIQNFRRGHRKKNIQIMKTVTKYPLINLLLDPSSLQLWQFELGRERIGIRCIQVSKSMIDLTMLGLVRTYIQQQRSHTTLSGGHLPVFYGHLRCLQLLPLRQVAVVEIIDRLGVGDHGLFFEVPNEPMADLRGDHVGQREAAEEYALCAEDHEPHQGTWFGELEECEQVHALVVGFFEEGFDPDGVFLACFMRRCCVRLTIRDLFSSAGGS